MLDGNELVWLGQQGLFYDFCLQLGQCKFSIDWPADDDQVNFGGLS